MKRIHTLTLALLAIAPAAAFRSILDEFRHRYLITYQPRGVPREGWHKLEVRVNRRGATVRARPGYQGR